ncbi:MAG: hypothetical protein V8S38_12515 [Lachnospiraceae bacterium]
MNSSIRSDFLLVDKVEKLSDTSLSITLKEPFPALLDKLTVGIVPEHCFEGQDINTADLIPLAISAYSWYRSITKCIVEHLMITMEIKHRLKISFICCPDYNTRALHDHGRCRAKSDQRAGSR